MAIAVYLSHTQQISLFSYRAVGGPLTCVATCTDDRVAYFTNKANIATYYEINVFIFYRTSHNELEKNR